MLKSFLTQNLSLNIPIQLEHCANICFNPIRYLFYGRTVTIFLAAASFVPEFLIGTPTKLLSHCFDSERTNYQIAKEPQHPSSPLLEKDEAEKAVDLFNLDLIYQSEEGGFTYSLPKSLLEGFLSGKAFDHQECYSPEELQDLKSDISDIYQMIMSEKLEKGKVALITAGAPGAGKTTLLKQDCEAQSKNGRKIAYICPDDVCLSGQSRTYQKDIAEKIEVHFDDGEKKKRRQEAYNKWRPGSNAATHIILAHLILKGYSFYFGITSSSPATAKLFEFLKEKGYKIRLLHISTPDNVRWESIQERDKFFLQTTEEDIREKGKLVPQRITDTYMKFADEIDFYYRDSVKKDAVLAAKWMRNPQPQNEQILGTLSIIDTKCYEEIKKIHNSTCESLNKLDLLWENAVEQKSLKFVQNL